MKQKHKNITGYYFDGVPIHAAIGLHESASALIEKQASGCGGLALDLGCGSGAFSKRLQKLGYETISADLSLDTFSLSTESCVVDLNSNFSEVFKYKSYDVIVALEVIEHLENPLHFLRQLKLLANENTQIIISFPNIDLYVSFFSFFRHGTFANWSPFLYWETGHQTILTPWLFQAHLQKVGLQMNSFEYCAPFYLNTKNAFKRLYYAILKNLLILLSPAHMIESRDNEVALFSLRKDS